MGLYTKFVVNGDCRAFYFVEGRWQRLCANEVNNVKNPLSESEVMLERQRLGIPFASLKTEAEVLALDNLPLPE